MAEFKFRDVQVVKIVWAIVLVASSAAIGPAQADSTSTIGAQLPVPVSGASAVWVPSSLAASDCLAGCAYVFGGGSDRILRFDPLLGDEDLSVMGARLPTVRSGTSAVWDGRDLPAIGCPQGCAYVFGGVDASFGSPDFRLLNETLRYNPASDSLVRLNATLPIGRAWTSAVWDGNLGYVLGGQEGVGFDGRWVTGAIARFDPLTGSIIDLPFSLPRVTMGASAAWDPVHQRGYVFGGYANCGATGVCSFIQRFTPSNGSATLLPAALPSALDYTSATWIDGAAFVYGGRLNVSDPRRLTDEILRFDTSIESVSVQNGGLPTPRMRTAAVASASLGGAAYIFGGEQEDGGQPTAVLRYDPAVPNAKAGVTPDCRLVAYDDDDGDQDPAGDAAQVGTPPPLRVCLEPVEELVRLDIQRPTLGDTRRVAAFVDSYAFSLPTGGSALVPCVTLLVNQTEVSACGAAGGAFRDRVATLVDRPVPEPDPDGVPAAGIGVCRSLLTVTAGGFGIEGVPVVSPC